MTGEFIDRLAGQERSLLRRYGVRLRVDKVTDDGRYALCSACQVEQSFFRPLLPDVTLVTLAERAFMTLNTFGLKTLISVLPKGPLTVFPVLDPLDPFHLSNALSIAAREQERPPEPRMHNRVTIEQQPAKDGTQHLRTEATS